MIVLHSTRLGPAAGGCRLWRYDDVSAATRDAMRLAEGMACKTALADLPLGAHLGVGTPDAKMLAVVPDRVLAVQVRIGGPQPDPVRGPLDPSTA